MTQDIDIGKLAEQINDKADRDLWNTVPNVWNNTLNTSQITNCITEIPQDIKLELNNGTLTLKAGSKVYVPNGKNADGSNKFDEVFIESDISLTQVWGSSQTFLLFYDANGLRLRIYDTGRCYSGTTSVSDGAYYNTNDNKFYVYDGGSLNFTASLPIAIITGQSPTITSIDQVFNGFGYIGSTVFALPGVKGLIPNGRNEDGSLNNMEFTTTSVLIRTNTNWNTFVWTDGRNIYISNSRKYNEQENYIYESNGSKILQLNIGYAVADSTGRITSFTPKTAFHALDYNDKSTISDYSTPDWDKALTAFSGNLYNSAKTYTLPDNGFVFITTQNQINVGSSTNLTNNKNSYVFKTFSMGVGGKDYGQYFGGKGEIISLSATSASTAITSIFVPLKGAN